MGEGGLLLLLLVLLAGLVAFVFGAIALVFKMIGAVCSSVLGAMGVGPRRVAVPARGTRVCGNPRCRRAEVRAARYCSRCGRALA